jgi:hypothetical protein
LPKLEAVEAFIRLLLAHVVGEGVLRAPGPAARVRALGWRSPWLYGHAALQAGLAALLAVDPVPPALAAGVVGLAHLALDGGAVALARRERFARQGLFLAVQAAQVALLALLAWGPEPPEPLPWAHPRAPWLALAALLLTLGGAALVRAVLALVAPDVEDAEGGLALGGRAIGMLERLLVFAFLVLGRWEGVGILLGAKSVFRFPDLSRQKDRKLTEYVLVGTLLSFGWAMAVAWCYLRFRP